mmetsp:Transcript_53196/g.168926  ORF Transcript_53196/g.168926 Transcript_53196/m.168926 type:complete len:255 (-) Transcript_53196:127-891(-)
MQLPAGRLKLAHDGLSLCAGRGRGAHRTARVVILTQPLSSPGSPWAACGSWTSATSTVPTGRAGLPFRPRPMRSARSPSSSARRAPPPRSTSPVRCWAPSSSSWPCTRSSTVRNSTWIRGLQPGLRPGSGGASSSISTARAAASGTGAWGASIHPTQTRPASTSCAGTSWRSTRSGSRGRIWGRRKGGGRRPVRCSFARPRSGSGFSRTGNTASRWRMGTSTFRTRRPPRAPSSRHTCITCATPCTPPGASSWT